MSTYLRSSLNNGLNTGLRQSISGGVDNLGFFKTASLDLQFASKKTLNDRVSGSNLITFTRASSATYVDGNGVIQSATTNTPRFDYDPATGESLGLLIEEARTNGDSNSATLSNWGVTNATFADQAITAPDGSTTAKLLTEDTSTGNHKINENYDNIYTGHALSFFVKPNGRTKFRIRLDNTAGGKPVDFDLTNMTVTPVGTNTSGSIQEFANGWFRISAVTTGGNRGYCGFRLLDNSGNDSYTGDGTSGVYIWGVQYEKASSFSTSYIPTSGSTVTRAADVAQITGTNFSSWYNQSEGTLFADVNPVNTTQGGVWSSTNSSVTDINEGLTMQGSTAQLRCINYLDSGSTFNDIVFNSPPAGSNKLAVAGSISDDTTGAYFDGSTGTVNASRAQGYVNVAGAKIGVRSNQRMTGHIKRLSYFSTRLPDATLESITS